jgi:arabinose-5-phosphate isomerase
MIDLFKKKRQYLNYFFDHLDIKKANQILELLYSCKNNIIFTGIGKSAIIANKIAMTMLSTGTKALFLPAIDALHGDIATITKDDVFVVFSKSGETDELLNLIPYVKKREAKVIAVVSNENSRLAKISDYYIYLPLEKELCPYNLAPTTSTSIQLIFGDVLTIALMQKKNFSITQYALNHPAGAIGKQITLKVKDLMIKNDDLPICFEKDLIKNVLHILSSKKCGCLLILDKENKFKGIFTDGDLRRLIQSQGENFFNKKMKDIMIQMPLSIDEESLAIDAMRKMEEKKQITVMPVVRDNFELVGLIRMHDIIQSGLKSLL